MLDIDPNIKLTDRYGRHLNYLRISITDRCNLRCTYCVPRNRIPKISHKDILRYEELLRLVRIGVRLGISKVRITGGEPLVRKGVYAFLEKLTRIDGLLDVSLTTNGVFLKKHIDKIKAAGINRINVSLDTLNRQKYKEITGHDFFHRVWEGIELAHSTGFAPIKLNVVALKGINDNELIDLARLSFSYPFHIRFIEQMPIGSSGIKIDNHLLVPEIKDRISPLGELMPVAKEINDGPARRYRFAGAKGEIGFISPLTDHFCNKCNRLRLTASGRLRSCLLSGHQEDIKGPLRSGCLDTDLVDIILEAVRNKPFEHGVGCSRYDRVSGQMSSIGG